MKNLKDCKKKSSLHWQFTINFICIQLDSLLTGLGLQAIKLSSPETKKKIKKNHTFISLSCTINNHRNKNGLDWLQISGFDIYKPAPIIFKESALRPILS